MSRYDVKSILESSTLPIGGAAKRLKDVEAQAAEMTVEGQRRDIDHHDNITSSQLSDGTNGYHGWPTLAFQQQQPYSMHYPTPYGQRVWCKQEQDSDNVHGFQDHLHHQLQLGDTHNFFQQSSVLHNLMGMESGSMEHSSAGSNNSVIYSSSSQGGGNGYGSHIGGYVIPMSTVIGNNDHHQQHHQGNSNGFVGESDEEQQVKALGYDQNHVFASTDIPYHHARNNVYYLSHQSSVLPAGVVKASAYDHHDHDHDQSSTCNNWVPTAVPTVKQYGCTLPWSSNVHTTTLE